MTERLKEEYREIAIEEYYTNLEYNNDKEVSMKIHMFEYIVDKL